MFTKMLILLLKVVWFHRVYFKEFSKLLLQVMVMTLSAFCSFRLSLCAYDSTTTHGELRGPVCGDP